MVKAPCNIHRAYLAALVAHHFLVVVAILQAGRHRLMAQVAQDRAAEALELAA